MIDPPNYIQPMSVRESQLRCVIADLKTQVQERDAVLRQALEALEDVRHLVDYYWGGTSHDEAIEAIKEVLK